MSDGAPAKDPGSGPTIFANRSPIDVPDDFPGVIPQFRSRRGAEALPKLRPAEAAKGFGGSGRPTPAAEPRIPGWLWILATLYLAGLLLVLVLRVLK